MKFKIGDIVEVVRPSWYLKFKTVGALGKVVDIRSFHSHRPTHYVVKFTHYKIPHYYPISELDFNCELYKIKKNYEKE